MGVESICDRLTESGCKIAPATYYEHRSGKQSVRQVRDAELKPLIVKADAENFGFYGARKVWLTLNRNFSPLAPDRLWVADFSYVSTWSGWCYTAFVIDAYARRILDWSVATTMTAQLVLDAGEQAIWTRHRQRPSRPRGSTPLGSSRRPVLSARPTTMRWPSP